MDHKKFSEVLKSRIVKTEKVLDSKAKEYSRGDRFSNFKKASPAMGCTPEQACVAFWMKHVISINDLVNDLKEGKVAPAEVWDEKIGDAINYLILLDGLVQERLFITE